ncbi:mitochondrial import receptor subunit tom20 [Naganishia albida]|nr:mitochondrial import receptor subunit tom20 [Naganishia albida]
MPSNTQLALTGLAVVATGFVGYAAWFDYKRRNDPVFRKNLKREHKKIHASAAKEEKVRKVKNTAMLKASLVEISKETLPTSPQEREQYFMEQVAMGEGLAAAGPINEVPAALCFYRALRVYPSPVELIMIYQKTVPASIFALLMELTSLDLEAGKDVPTAKPSAADVDDETPAVTAAPASTSAAPPAGTTEAAAAPEVLAASAEPEAPAVPASEEDKSTEGNGSGTEWETLTDEGKAAQA